jgi:hypothetical protein
MTRECVQPLSEEQLLWEFELPLWKRLPAYCSDPSQLRFNGSVLYGGYVAFSARRSEQLPRELQGSQPRILVTLAAADSSLPELYGYLDTYDSSRQHRTRLFASAAGVPGRPHVSTGGRALQEALGGVANVCGMAARGCGVA